MPNCGVEWVNQTQLASLIGMSRVTITQRQSVGMPYRADGPGNSNQYYFPLVLYWEIGYTAMTTRQNIAKQGLRDQALTYAVGRLVASTTPENVELGKQTLMKGLKLNEQDAAAAFDRAQGWWIATEGGIPR